MLSHPARTCCAAHPPSPPGLVWRADRWPDLVNKSRERVALVQRQQECWLAKRCYLATRRQLVSLRIACQHRCRKGSNGTCGGEERCESPAIRVVVLGGSSARHDFLDGGHPEQSNDGYVGYAEQKGAAPNNRACREPSRCANNKSPQSRARDRRRASRARRAQRSAQQTTVTVFSDTER